MSPLCSKEDENSIRECVEMILYSEFYASSKGTPVEAEWALEGWRECPLHFSVYLVTSSEYATVFIEQ